MPAHVYVAGAADERAARSELERKGYRRVERGGWIVYLARSIVSARLTLRSA